MNNFYKKYISLCAKANKAPSAVAEAIGLSRTSPNGWKKGNKPKDTTIEKLALYFDVPVSYFSEEQFSLVKAVPTDDLSALPNDERLMLSYYRQMTREEQSLIENMAKTIIKAKEK